MLDANQVTKILVTGVTGFIGKALTKKLVMNDCYQVSCLVRTHCFVEGAHQVFVGDLNDITDDMVENIDVIVHLAGMAHTKNSTEDYFRVNSQAAAKLASFAANAGVKRFIFLSSIGVNGAFSRTPFSHQSEPSPGDAYAKSKFEAELQLRKVLESSSVELVIIRPPLVYGRGAPGNFGRLLKLVASGLPIPFGAVKTRRSFVSIDNLISLIELCIYHPNAANGVFLVSDDRDVSLPEFLMMIGQASGKKIKLLHIPTSILKLFGFLTGRLETVDRLCGQLQVDITSTKTILGWQPIVSVEQGVKKCFDRNWDI